ncbi:TetR/AcrR family transcriptional regulator [Mycobacterium sp. EPa45]|uniref:TetR/AcrR family transcriptional regulator n=1 Tax=Mycobacterium sp. EPa45 TaxID=1545728 RepID=UPI000641FF5B|nr:TetR/AcrR family transcriptional regulator [Mycobacterium sp. EPa45]AKK29478.1 TetR family transcriptional regulator [Mycobacterium sp. EPa45]
MRSRGWAGATPASDEEAITRILDAVDDIVADQGAAIRLADVARKLGVTRQTVYHYFPNADALLVASTMRAADGFLDQVADHAHGLKDPVAAVTECISFATESLAGDPQLENLLTRRRKEEGDVSLTGETAIAFCLSIFHRLDVDWELHGFDGTALDGLAEVTLRTVQSLLINPSLRREGNELRGFVARWIGPAILFQRCSSLSSADGQTPVNPR